MRCIVSNRDTMHVNWRTLLYLVFLALPRWSRNLKDLCGYNFGARIGLSELSFVILSELGTKSIIRKFHGIVLYTRIFVVVFDPFPSFSFVFLKIRFKILKGIDLSGRWFEHT